MSTMTLQGAMVGTDAPDFNLLDHAGSTISLKSLLQTGPVFLVFYPGDFTFVCTKQLCDYRDQQRMFQEYGVQVIGISSDPCPKHREFREKFQLPFRLLCDPEKNIARTYGCTSLLMFGGISRAVFVINREGKVVYRYVEPTTLSRRKSDEIAEIFMDLKKRGQI